MESTPSAPSDTHDSQLPSTQKGEEQGATAAATKGKGAKTALVNDYLNPDDYRDLSVMVVDDTTASLMTIVPVLSDHGYAVRPVKDSKLALEKALSNPPDLIFLDVVMPKPDGFEVCQQLKANKRTNHIPVILVSAREDESYKLKGFEVGAVDYISKPFKAQEVLARVKHHISMSLLKRQLEQRNRNLQHVIQHYRHNQDVIRYLFQQFSYPMFSFEALTGKILMVNPALENLLGYPVTPVYEAKLHQVSPSRVQDILTSAEQAEQLASKHHVGKMQRYSFKLAQQQQYELDVHSYHLYLDGKSCVLVVAEALQGTTVEKTSQPVPEGELPASQSNLERFVPLFNALTASHTTEDIAYHTLDFLLPWLDAREGHILCYDFLMQPNKQLRKAGSPPLRVVAQHHVHNNGTMNFALEQKLDASHVVHQLVHRYQKPLFCQVDVAGLISLELQRYMYTLNASWLLLLPLRTLRAAPGALLILGESAYAPLPSMLDMLEVVRQQLAYRFDHNANVISMHSTMAS